MSTGISDSDILATFKINYGQFKSFLPDILFTADRYSGEIENFAKDLKMLKENNRKLIDIAWGRMGKVGIRICSNFGACGVRTYAYPEEASTVPQIRKGDILNLRSGTGTTEQVIDAYELLIRRYVKDFGESPKIYAWTHDLKSPVAETTNKHGGTVVYIRGEEEKRSNVVKNYFERQMKGPLPITPMGTHDEFSHIRFFDCFTLSFEEFLRTGKFSFRRFEDRFMDLCRDFSILEESLNDSEQQKWLINSVRDLASAKRLIGIAEAYTSVVMGMIVDRARNVFPEDVDTINYDSSKRPIHRLIIPDTKLMSISKTGESRFTLRDTLRAKEFGASYTLITENPKAKLAKGCNKKIIEPDTSSHWRTIGRYLLRTEEMEMVIGDCLLMATAAAMGRTETDMLNDHMAGYRTK